LYARRCKIPTLSSEPADLESRLSRVLRSLDAIHLATFVLARRELEGLELLTVDERLRTAATEPGGAGA
jgi:predicted nucleic acid-binding protein